MFIYIIAQILPVSLSYLHLRKELKILIFGVCFPTVRMLVNLLMRHIVNFCESHGVFKDNPKMKTIFQLMAEVSTAIHFVVPSVYVMIRSSDSVLGKIFLFLYQSYGACHLKRPKAVYFRICPNCVLCSFVFVFCVLLC